MFVSLCFRDVVILIWNREEVSEEVSSENEDETSLMERDLCSGRRCSSIASVYKLSYGARVYEALDEAGGLLDTADASGVNQAEKVEDGQKIIYSTTSETEEAGSAGHF